MTAIDPFDEACVESLGEVLGDTSTGFTGSEIASLLRACRVPDPGAITKRVRISTALAAEQARTHSGASIVAFVTAAMKPVRWHQNPDGFQAMRERVNTVLAYSGLYVGHDGTMRRRAVATTHSEAQQRSRRLRDEMQRRNGHAEVFRYCAKELVADDCFGAVFEATKGLADRVRTMTGLDLDGAKLVDTTFSLGNPMVVMNGLRTDTERNEQVGLASLMKGAFSAFRNPTAHEPRVFWHVSEADALDLLSTLSLIHRRLDAAVVLRIAP